ncbi:hypothetical protein D3C86_1537810 [compost metagenome]
MQPAVVPQLGALFRLLEIALGQPGRAHYDLAQRLAVMGHVVAAGIDDFQVDHRHRRAGLDPGGQLRLGGLIEVCVTQVSQAQQRAGLGHAVAAVHLNAFGAGFAGNAQGQRTAAQEHFPAVERGLLRFITVEDHLQDRRHAMGEGDLLFAEQPHQAVGFVTAGVHLLDAHQGRDIGHAPGMHVEHRGDGHVDVVGT